MRRYFFDIDHGAVITDEDGELLADVAAARRTAALVLSDVLGLHADDMERIGPLIVRVRDGDGVVVHAVQARIV
jgi:hypothetical protein